MKYVAHYCVALAALCIIASGQPGLAAERHGALVQTNAAPTSCITKSHIQNIYHAIGTLETHGIDGKSFQEQFKRDIRSTADCRVRSQNIAKMLHRIEHGLMHGFSARYDHASFIHHHTEDRFQNHSTTQLVERWNHMASARPEYRSLQTILANYRMFKTANAWPAKVASGKTIKPGMSDPRLTQIQELLYIMGDHTQRNSAQKQHTPTTHYDDRLVAAVISFQMRHGLTADGVIGPQTLQAMNIPLAERIDKIKLSMERLRQADFSGENYVHVNIPSYQLVAYENNSPALRMKVIVGKTKRKTPLFNNQITGLVFNPTWTPTQRILREDILPKIRANPDYAARGNYTIIDRYSGRTLSPYEVDWYNVSANDIRLRQGSGRGNAMGKVKFVLPDSNAIYLHDTAKPQLFSKASRALSSGCIRVENPKALVDYVVQQQASLPYSKANRWYQSDKNRHVKIDTPVSVYTTYFTAWVNKKGQPTFYQDIYRKDKQLTLALNRSMLTDDNIQIAMK